MNSLDTTVSDYQEPSSTDLCQVDLYYALRHARGEATLLPLSVIAEMLVDCCGQDVRLLVNFIELYDKREAVAAGDPF